MGEWGAGGCRAERGVQGREEVLQLQNTNQPGRETVTSFPPKWHLKNAHSQSSA